MRQRWSPESGNHQCRHWACLKVSPKRECKYSTRSSFPSLKLTTRIVLAAALAGSTFVYEHLMLHRDLVVCFDGSENDTHCTSGSMCCRYTSLRKLGFEMPWIPENWMDDVDAYRPKKEHSEFTEHLQVFEPGIFIVFLIDLGSSAPSSSFLLDFSLHLRSIPR